MSKGWHKFSRPLTVSSPQSTVDRGGKPQKKAGGKDPERSIHRLQSVDCLLSTADCRLSTVDCRLFLTLHVNNIRKHRIHGGHDLRVCLESTLGGDHLDKLVGYIHIGLLQGVCGDAAQSVGAG